MLISFHEGSLHVDNVNEGTDGIDIIYTQIQTRGHFTRK